MSPEADATASETLHVAQLTVLNQAHAALCEVLAQWTEMRDLLSRAEAERVSPRFTVIPGGRG